MKKLSPPLLSFVLVIAFLVPISVFAQVSPASGNFVLVSQGVLSSSTPAEQLGSTAVYSVDIGSGYTGSTTGAFTSATWVPAGGQYVNFVLEIIDNTTSFYCAFQSLGAASPPTPFEQLTFQACTGTDSLVFNPDDDYSIDIQNVLTSGLQSSYRTLGSDGTLDPRFSTSGLFTPQFAIVGNGFQITPTSTSTGVFLSGAYSFCSGQFSSSSMPFLVSDTAVGFCTVAGYLLVPTPASLQQFASFPYVLQNKIPFSYFYGVSGDILSMTASSSQNFGGFEINLGSTTGVGSTSPIASSVLDHNFVLLSTSTISTYVSPTLYNLLYSLAVAAIWITTALILYRRVVPVHVTDA